MSAAAERALHECLYVRHAARVLDVRRWLLAVKIVDGGNPVRDLLRLRTLGEARCSMTAQRRRWQPEERAELTTAAADATVAVVDGQALAKKGAEAASSVTLTTTQCVTNELAAEVRSARHLMLAASHVLRFGRMPMDT